MSCAMTGKMPNFIHRLQHHTRPFRMRMCTHIGHYMKEYKQKAFTSEELHTRKANASEEVPARSALSRSIGATLSCETCTTFDYDW